MRNVVLVDFEPPKDWNFICGLEESSEMTWEIAKKISNLDRKGKIGNLKRYLKYFFFSFKIFIRRKKFSNIIAWQQFYGLFFAFFCRFFHVKKRVNLTIMTYIYKPKKGLKGKIYYKLMQYIVTSKYIDRLIVFSSSEVEQYKNDFNIEENKFVYIPLGEDVLIERKHDSIEKNNIVFASGFSNRDFDFLCEVAKKTPNVTYHIYGYSNYKTENVFMTDEIVGDKLNDLLNSCKIVAVPLKENRSSGQLTVLHAFEAGIPVIATNSDSMSDYIINCENGILCQNDVELWVDMINKLLNDVEFYEKISKNAMNSYYKKHTVKVMGYNIGKYFER